MNYNKLTFDINVEGGENIYTILNKSQAENYNWSTSDDYDNYDFYINARNESGHKLYNHSTPIKEPDGIRFMCCYQCEKVISEGDKVVLWPTILFCSKECKDEYFIKNSIVDNIKSKQNIFIKDFKEALIDNPTIIPFLLKISKKFNNIEFDKTIDDLNI